jgi:hypothetical protein
MKNGQNDVKFTRDRYQTTYTARPTTVLGPVAGVAEKIVTHFALIAAVPDGEDSSGQQKHRLATPEELAKRACDVAQALATELESRGLIHDMPDDDGEELVKSAAAAE